jgi:hypothetical protein
MEPRIIHILQLIQDQQWSCHDITTVDTKIIHIGVRNTYIISLQTSLSKTYLKFQKENRTAEGN